MNVDGGLDGEGGVAAYDFATRYPSNAAPTLALLLTGKIMATPDMTDMGDRTAIGPYDFANHRVTVHDMAPLARAAWLRGVSAMPNTFAHESYIDELASEAGVDPVAYRLRYLKDERAAALVSQVAAKVGWEPRTGARRQKDAKGNLVGQGFAYAVYVHSKFPGLASALVGLGGGRRGQPLDRRGFAHPGDGRPGLRPHDQSGRRAPPDSTAMSFSRRAGCSRKR